MLPCSFYRRLAVVTLLLAAGFAWLEYRLFNIQILRHQELLTKADGYLQVRRVLEPWRGEIRSRDGEALAMDVPEKEMWADLVVCADYAQQIAEVLAPLLQIEARRLSFRLQPALIGFRPDGEPIYRQVALLKRHVPISEWDRIRAALAQATFGLEADGLERSEEALLDRLRRRAIFTRETHQRLYPFGELLSPVLGFVGATHDQASVRGQAGLERSMQAILAGAPGSLRSDRAAGGIELPWHRTECRDPVDGNHVVLTIHAPLQRIVEEALAEIQSLYSPSNASILAVRPSTGEILAFGAVPRFDPQQPGKTSATAWRNPAISAMVEPGSTFKLITLAAALNEGLVRLEEGIYCEEGTFTYRAPLAGRQGFRPITLRDYKPFGWLSVEEILAKSSNIGAAKLALRLGPDRLYEYIKRFGFGARTGIPLPGEMPGWISPPTNWLSGAMLYIPMGQGIAVTQLQMTLAYAAIANDGLLMRPLLIDRIESPAGEVLARVQPQALCRVVDPKTARLVRLALQSVVTKGTGSAAASELFAVAGKTGTAQKSDRTGYLPGRFYASFIGFLPADRPELCISVALDEPQRRHQGGAVAAPAFKVVAEAAAALLRIEGGNRGLAHAGPF